MEANRHELRQFATDLFKFGANVTAIRSGSKIPLHSWQQWQLQRQTKEEFRALPWDKAAAVGLINGSGSLRVFDIDAPKNSNGRPLYKVPESVLKLVLEKLELVDSYGWSYVSGGGGGFGVVVRCEETLPPEWGKGVIQGKPVKNLQFDHLELRWGSGQTVVMGNHPTGPGYLWRGGVIPFYEPVSVTVDQVMSAFQAIAVPNFQKQPSRIRMAETNNSNGQYGRAALRHAANIVRTAVNGTRNNTLFKETASLAELVNGQLLNRSQS